MEVKNTDDKSRRWARVPYIERASLGKKCEDLVCSLLEDRKLKIWGRNLRIGSLEVDLLACDEKRNALFVVEIRARSSLLRRPSLWITPRKKKYLLTAAQVFSRKYKVPTRVWLAEVLPYDGKYRVKFFEVEN